MHSEVQHFSCYPGGVVSLRLRVTQVVAQTTHFFAFLTLVSFPFVILEEGRGEFVFICWLRGLDVLVEAVPASGYLDWCNQAASMVLVADVIDRKEVERMQFLSQGPLQKALLVRNCLSDSSHSHCSTSAVLQDQWDFSVCSIILGRGYSEKLK